jgi:hypothetical protein
VEAHQLPKSIAVTAAGQLEKLCRSYEQIALLLFTNPRARVST